MNVGPINTSSPAVGAGGGAAAGSTQDVNAATGAGDTNGGNSEIQQNNVNISENDKEMKGEGPGALKQMSTSDFLSLREITQEESVMDKLEKIFETILALKLLEKTMEDVSESMEENSKGKK